MNNTDLHIRNMCCDRCIEVVKKLLKEEGYNPASVTVGEIVFAKSLLKNDLDKIREKLRPYGFRIVVTSIEKIVVKIHALICRYIVELVEKNSRQQKLSTFLSDMLHRSYYYLSSVFSSVTGLTIEKYFIRLKMEKAKELIILGEQSLSEIAWELGYSSQQTFSTQFKMETGKTPGAYRLHPEPKRIHWDKLLPQHFKQKSKLRKQ